MRFSEESQLTGQHFSRIATFLTVN